MWLTMAPSTFLAFLAVAAIVGGCIGARIARRR